MKLRDATDWYLLYSRRAVLLIAGSSLGLMVAINFAEILHRVLAGGGLSWVHELSIILAVNLYFLTYALIAKDREYIRIEYFVRGFSPRGQHVLAIALRLILLGFHGTLVWFASKAVAFTAMFDTPVLAWPEFVFYLPLALGCADVVVTEIIYLVWQLGGVHVEDERAVVLT
jgi:TRAP-type C4-dicarboxylate transport system permease small subunit